MASPSSYARALRRSLSLFPSPGQPALLLGLRPQLQPSLAPEAHLIRPFSSFSSNRFRCSSGFNCTCPQVACIHFKLMKGNRFSSHREYSVFKEFSKQLKGEAKSNSEFQQSVKELNEKFGVVKEDLKVRTQKATEKIYKSVDDVWTEAEATSKKVSANVKEKLSAAKEEVTANMKEKISAAREEVKETLGIGKEEPLASSHGSSDATSTNNQSTTGASHAEDCKESAQQAETFYDKFKTVFSSASPRVSLVLNKMKETKISDFAKRGYDIIKDELSSKQRRKKHIEYTSPSVSSEPRSTRTDIVVVASKKSRIGEKWEALKRKMQGHPAFKRMKNYSEPVVAKGQELAEDMRDRWETSDNPVVHKIQDLNETVFGETAAALSFKEIRRRDPSFSLQDFLSEVQEMIQPVLKAYFKCDVEALKKYCCSEVIERCKGERRAYESQDMFFDNKILHISEVDVRETKMMGSSPIIIVAFQTQQIYCVRDRSGEIKAGGKDTIQTVYYAWAMQQIDPEELGEDAYYPVWRLREMQQLNVQALI